MIKSLRGRLIVSHVLPLLVIIPLMGIALVYVLETRVLLPDIAEELAGDASLVADLAASQPELWTDPVFAQVFAARVGEDLMTRVMLLDGKGHLLASSVPADADRVGQLIQHPGLPDVLAGKMSVQAEYNPRLHAEAADVLVPVFGPDLRVIGVVRLTHTVSTVYQQFLRLRYLITGVLAAGLLLGVAVGWTLALDLARPLRRVTGAVFQLASGGQSTPLPEHGLEEVRVLSHAFNTLVNRLNTLEAARRQLLANLVHELGRPLGTLRSAIQALLNGAEENAALRRELLEGMEQETRHLQRLLDDLAQLHDQVLGTLDLDRRLIDLGDWLPPVLVAWREAARAKGLHWQTEVPADMPGLAVDPDRLDQVLGNLLSNAIKYTQPGGTVSVGAGAEREAIWIRVSDTGPGIEPAEQAHIFTPFYRSRKDRRFPDGMGLGLSIARDLVVAHGGRLEVESTPGCGSQFTVWLPIDTSSLPTSES